MTFPRPALPEGPWLIVGRGKAGQAAASLLAGRGAVSLWEEPEVRAEAAPAPAGVALVGEADPDAALTRLAPVTVIKSPGVPPDQPILAAAHQRGIEVMDELELGWRAVPRPIVGVTGTNGKSTTCALIGGALAAAGEDVAIAGNTDDGPALSSLAHDPPDRVVLEASSFQLEACPTLLADVAVLTNVTRDHLHRHGDMDAYAAAKARLFARGDRVAPAVVVNADDLYGAALGDRCEALGAQVVRVGFGEDAGVRIEPTPSTAAGQTVRVVAEGERIEIPCSLPGVYNARNVATALAVVRLLGRDGAVARAGLTATPRVVARWETIDEGQPFDVVVDYAHNPDGVAAVCGLGRELADARGTVLHVLLSAGGQQDPGKRGAMGEAVGRAADRFVVTSSSLRGETLAQVIDPVREGALAAGRARVEQVDERRAAIEAVVGEAGPGDVVLILGRGALRRLDEDVHGRGKLFDDREVAREALRARGYRSASPLV